MKKLKYTMLILFGALCSLLLFSCKKENSVYYNYQNKQQNFEGTALEYLQAQPKGTFDSLLFVLDRMPAIKELLEKESVTFFAPINKNFESAIRYLNTQRKLKGVAPAYLKDAEIAWITKMMCQYIIPGNRESEAYRIDRDGVTYNTILYDYPMHVTYVPQNASGFVGGGAAVLEFSDINYSGLKDYWVTTSTNSINIKTKNATLNILTPAHNFGFDKFNNGYQ